MWFASHPGPVRGFSINFKQRSRGDRGWQSVLPGVVQWFSNVFIFMSSMFEDVLVSHFFSNGKAIELIWLGHSLTHTHTQRSSLLAGACGTSWALGENRASGQQNQSHW